MSASKPGEISGFILTRHWHDREPGVELEFWLSTDQGPHRVTVAEQEAVFFIRQADLAKVQPVLGLQRGWRVQNLDLFSHTFEPVAALYFKSYKRARDAAQLLRRQIPVWEADIRPPERFLMERFIHSDVTLLGEPTSHQGFPLLTNPQWRPAAVAPAFKVASVDIETDMQAAELYSIAVYTESERRVFMVGEGAGEEASGEAFELHFCPTQTACLLAFFEWLQRADPDILIGWNFIGFDLWVLSNLCRHFGVDFAIGRLGREPSWRADPDDPEKRYISIPGRIALDGIELLRTAFYQFESFALGAVARQLLGADKLLSGGDRGEQITDWFHSHKAQLARYNLKDCELVWEIFAHTQLLEFARAKSQMTGLPLDRIGGSAAAFEFSYLPRLHRKGYVAPNIGENKIDLVSPGGYVLDSQPGLFRQVLLFDFKSLYPSIIRSFNIDPYAFWYAEHHQLPAEQVVAGFNDARFAREESILPGLVANLWQRRDEAKAHHNQPLSQAIKIIMNAYYGVLGSPLCRFFDPRVASSITLRGHQILQQTQAWFEQQGYRVIYGDTDSVFVWLGDESPEAGGEPVGRALATALNQYWRDFLRDEYGLSSYLEIQFESHFSRFFMPKIRGQETGSKKRYAGLVHTANGSKLLFRGLEAVRSDWTPLARRFQQSLFERVFHNREYRAFISAEVEQLLAGELDALLVYRKRLRRPLDDYEAISPPHVQAARKLAAAGHKIRKGDWIEYVWTTRGPEATALAEGAAIDYEHYLEKQMAPVVDGLLATLGTSFQAITNRQFKLF
ncbi:DNA polymerase II [Halioxenophilus sp. WMMB6]|uniref:DNA polymerase II n=1 Tax=Halioxenophilus sp. WMMB6 TaxID=3073815 RepID=UPI00295F3FE5|nr:DNA polymerase II [Halioxenophilus sp. WMMB6]